jgi:lipopolysaccharide transport system ATP-binding protein
MSSSDIAIRVQGLSKRYEIYSKPSDRLKQFVMPLLQRFAGKLPKQYFREFWALKDVSFEVKKGQTVGIIGRNGSGKSTLLQMICGTLTPTTGSIQTRGRVAALLELGSGFNPEFTGRENVYMNAAVLGLSSAEVNARFSEIVDFADIGDFIEQPVKTYSSGMMVRLAFAVIAHVDADILIVDEALAVGDAFFSQKCMRFLRKFMENGTVLFVSHDTGAVINLCSAGILLNRGQIVEIGTPKEVSEHYLATLCEVNQKIDGLQNPAIVLSERQGAQASEYRDMREDLFRNSTLRNDVEVFEFLPQQNGFGTGDAKIVSVRVLDESGAPLNWIVGGENVIFEIQCSTQIELLQPIIGFDFKDRLGQTVFGDNSYLVYRDKPFPAAAGSRIVARFEFRLPVLPTGDYSITAAIAEGTQASHVQHHWMNDALIMRVHASSVFFGLIGVPMSSITLQAS